MKNYRKKLKSFTVLAVLLLLSLASFAEGSEPRVVFLSSIVDTTVIPFTVRSRIGEAVSGKLTFDNIVVSCGMIRYIPEEGPACCQGMRGNADGDPSDAVDISDLTFLIGHLFIPGSPAPLCFEEADCNADGSCDIADLTQLIGYLFLGGQPPADCGYSAPPAPKSGGALVLNTYYSESETRLELTSDIDIRGIQLQLAGPQLPSGLKAEKPGMECLYGYEDGMSRMGIVDLQGLETVGKGTHTLVTLPGKVEVLSAVAADSSSESLPVRVAPAAKEESLPDSYEIDQNYPNPFNPTTTIAYSMPEPGKVTIEVYNIAGQKVATLVNGFMDAGHHEVIWDSRNSDGGSVASGVYLYRMETSGFTASKKMLLLK